ncbi:hypothetical protein Q1695_013908 [Nippostrongylus brasiliensis]|nr:hypothetical protein Q1695_013908 [Nippostrongylus brasiliensis]
MFSEKWSVDVMLPMFAEITEHTQLRRIGYTVQRHPFSKGLVYCYYVTWTDKADRNYDSWKAITAKMLNSNKVELLVPVRCDGPCGKMTDIDYVHFGLCEHNVCRHCYETAESADHEGIHGCCNVDCLDLARNDPKYRKREDSERFGHSEKLRKRRPMRIRSDESFQMEYDDSEMEHLVNKMRRSKDFSETDNSEGE